MSDTIGATCSECGFECDLANFWEPNEMTAHMTREHWTGPFGQVPKTIVTLPPVSLNTN